MKKIVFFGKGFSFIVVGFLISSGSGLIPIKTQTTAHKIEYDFIIITPACFSNELQPLVTHKEQYAITTKIVTLDDIYDSVFFPVIGRDDAEKIKYFIKTAKDEWGINYVLLVGGHKGQSSSWYMPIRYVYLYDDCYKERGYVQYKFISDLYFADLYDNKGEFSSWDSNNNGIFGEWIGSSAEDDYIDLYPDVAIGRLPCRNIFDVKIMVDKIINYETKTYGQDWFKKIVTVGGDSYPECTYNKSIGYEGEDVAKQIINNMSGFIPINLWASIAMLTKKNIIDKINQGCGFIYFHGHSSAFEFATHMGPNSTDTEWSDFFSTLDMNMLHNNLMMPICLIHGCNANCFDVTLLNLFNNKKDNETMFAQKWIPKCWGEKFTYKKDGGSIATIGCTGLGKTKEDKDSFEMTGEMIDSLFFWEYGVNKSDILGDAWSSAIRNYLDTHDINWSSQSTSDSSLDVKTVQQWILFGDPTLKIGGYS